MCGIAGYLNFNNIPINPQQLEAMVHQLKHRGPDGAGMEIRENVGLGHRRLAIIDLETGQQPMFNEDYSVAVTFNGEIYNYQELVSLLETQGHIFRTRSDTEVIVHAWEEWGKQCVERFRGMFAFAVADWRQGLVFLARDHLGIKPLYYTLNHSHFAFASEIQALQTLPDRYNLDPQALNQFLALSYIPAPRTIFKEISKLPPAHRLMVRFDGQREGPERYWSLTFNPVLDRSIEEWSEALEAVIRDSVEAHLVADVPFGAFLSGGMDSTVVVGMMAETLNQPVRTFSIGFAEEQYSELPYAKQVAERWQTEHYTEIVKPDALAILPNLVKHYGEPFGDISAIPTFYVSQLARQSVPMILSGDGGDEAFGGYNTYRRWLKTVSPPAHDPLWKQALRPIARLVAPWRYNAGSTPTQLTLEHWQSVVGYIPSDLRHRLWRRDYRDLVNLPIDTFEAAYARTNGYSPLHQAQYLDYQTYLPNDILTKVDIASMMHGLEVRTPFVDIRVVEFAATIPSEFKIYRDDAGEWIKKRLLRRMLSKHFPPNFINRPKRGFTIPINEWFAPGGALRSELESRLLNKKANIYEYFEPEAVSSLITAHGTNIAVGRQLWLLFFFETWLTHLKEQNIAHSRV